MRYINSKSINSKEKFCVIFLNEHEQVFFEWMCVYVCVTHSVDPWQLLGELQHDGDEERLPIRWWAEKLEDGHLLLHGHLSTLLLHLPKVFTHILTAAQTHKCCGQNSNQKYYLSLFWHLYIQVMRQFQETVYLHTLLSELKNQEFCDIC